MDNSKINYNVLKQEVESLYRATAKLNLYTQRIKVSDVKRVSTELENIYLLIRNIYDTITP